MREFQVEGRTISAYLAEPLQGSGPGVLVLHAWWGLTQPFRQICDRLAEAGFVALAPDLYHGKTTAAVEEAEALVAALNQDKEGVRGDIAGAVQVLREHVATPPAGGHGKLAVAGFSLGGAYALDLSVNLTEEIAAVVTFYCAYSGLEYSRARATYLCHFAENDPFDPPEAFAEMEQEIQAAGRPITSYTYPGTTHWFFEENRPEYDAQAARVAWERTIEFLHERLD
ncbi:dienelactone hydrolase family protein [Ktedonobacter robiniae]|uniref:Dienelactone hydrolase n=1 Tax=Ktedonobacter robiniae TaxID=2778365 RepID=A0ABQ3V5V1_9CHLR|nr:dienelactone hydrolase family protein [Ktedonobacter robiniae]GHO60313.1 dienelactone hydrolase [Ktedonobacter robiniae]